MAVFTALSAAAAAGGFSAGVSAFFVSMNSTLIGQLLLSVGTSALIGALSPKPAAAAQRGYETNVLGAGLDHTIIYGETKVGGVVVYNEATGTGNKFLHRVIAVAGHEVESFDRIYIDDAYIDFGDLDSSGNVPSVVDPDGTTSDRYNNKLRIQVAYGTPTQAANSDLVSESDSLWTNNHKLSGIAYIYVRLAFDADVYPNGIPTFTAVVKGKKVFDPRTNTTAWSDNPALCVRDYLTSTGYGLGEVAANIDDDLVESAANVCDQTVFSTTRYTINGSFTTSAAPYDLISSILPSMGGSLWYAQGKWRMKPAYWTTPVMSLDEDDLRSSISVSTRHSRRDNFNVIKGKFSGPETNWQQADYKEVRNETSAGSFVTGLPYSISEVGTTDFTAIGASSNTVGEVFTATGAGTGSGVADLNLGVDNGLTSVADVDLLFTDTMKEARRLGRITLERNRQQLTISASFGLKTLGLQVGDNVYITNSRFGWTNKAFEVLSWSFGLTDELDLQTQMTLRETAETAFDEVDDATAYEADNTNLPSPFFVPAPSLDAPVVTTTINEDGTAVPAIDFSWGVSNSQVVDHYDFQWKLTGATNYSSVVVEEPRFRLAPALSGSAYNYRVRAVNTLGVKSSYVSGASSVSTGNDATIPKAPTSVSVSGGYAATTVEWTAPTQNTDNSAIKDLFQYEVYRGTSSNPTTLVGVVAGTTFSDIGLNNSTTYYYRVKALDFTGNSSAYSANGSATTNPALENGADGASVLVVYADDASGTNQSLTAGSREYVLYYEYTGTAPSLPVSGTFVKFVGGAGSDGNSIFPIYADSAAGSNQSFDPSGKTFVTFFESATTPSLPVSGQTFVEYVGEDGQTGASTNIIFRRSATAPSTPSPSSGIPSGWYDSPPSGTELIWASSGTKLIGVTNFTWGTPWQVEGAAIAEVSIYRLNSNSGGTGGSYNFVTQTLTPPSGWSTNPPSLASNGDTIYRKSGVASGAATQTSASVSYGSAVVYAKRTDGTDGAAGTNGSPATGGVLPAYTNLQSYTTSVVDHDSEYALSSSTSGTNATANLQAARKLKAGYSNSASVKDKALAQIQEDDFVTITESVTGAKAAFKITSITRRSNYTNNGVSGQYYYDMSLDFVEGNGVTTSISYTSGSSDFVCDFSRSFSRAAGRWNIGVTSLPTTSSAANTAFTNAIGAPVDKDQAWFYTGTAANPTSQGVWLYDAGTPVWTEQDEVIDGNLLVSGTVTAAAIDADAITGKNVTVGNLTATTVPTGSQKGARIQADGTMFVGDKSEYLRWDGSVLSINGEIVNLGDFNKTPYSGGWSSFTSSLNLGDRMDLLGGAGLYAIFMAGAGGSGSASGRINSIASYACGGSSGAGAFFVFDYDGSDNVQFVSGSGGAGVTGGGSSSSNNGRDGNNGGNSLFQVGGSTKVTCSGGNGGDASNSSATSGPSAPSTPSDSRITEFVGYSGGAGGSSVATSASGGGGLGFFYASTSRGGNALVNYTATAGGGPFGRGGETSTSYRATGPAYPEDSDGFTINTTAVKVVSSPAGYFSGGSGALDVIDRADGTDSTGFLGGRGSFDASGNASAGSAGFLAGGGGAIVSDDDVATAGHGGPAGGGGGANKSNHNAGESPVSGDGGNGIIFIKKL